MKYSPKKIAVALFLIAAGVALGIFLLSYAQKDDAPGLGLIAFLIMAGAVALGVRTARRKA